MDKRVERDREDDFSEAGDGQMTERHGRDGNGQAVRAVERVPGGVMEEIRLDAELDGRAQGSRVDADIGTDTGGDVLARRSLDRLVHGMVDRVADEGQDERHVETVGTEGEDASIAKEQRL